MHDCIFLVSFILVSHHNFFAGIMVGKSCFLIFVTGLSRSIYFLGAALKRCILKLEHKLQINRQACCKIVSEHSVQIGLRKTNIGSVEIGICDWRNV